MKRFNVCTKTQYELNGEEKVYWNRCGSLRMTDEGKLYMQLFQTPDVVYYLFEDKAQEEKKDVVSDSSPF